MTVEVLPKFLTFVWKQCPNLLWLFVVVVMCHWSLMRRRSTNRTIHSLQFVEHTLDIELFNVSEAACLSDSFVYLNLQWFIERIFLLMSIERRESAKCFISSTPNIYHNWKMENMYIILFFILEATRILL